MGSWRAGPQQPAVLRSAWYRLPPRDQAGPLLVIAAAGRFDPGEVVVQWATDEQALKGQPGGGLGFADVGAAPAWRNLRAFSRSGDQEKGDVPGTKEYSSRRQQQNRQA
jgi:arabinosyltransferase C